MECMPEEHVHEVYPYGMHTPEMHVRKVWGNPQVSHLINGGVMVDLSRSDLPNTSFCAKRRKVPISHRRQEKMTPVQNHYLFHHLLNSTTQLLARKK
jgi:hypothetical protein